MTSSVLEHWLQQEHAVRERLARGPGPGVATREQTAGKTGLQIMQGLLSGELPFAAMAQTLDFVLIEVSPGQAVFQGTPGLQHMNPLGTVHGGWFATLLDSALGCAVHTMMPPGRGYTTADLSVKLVKAITPKVQRVRAIGKVVHCGRQLATAEAQLVGPDGTLYAQFDDACNRVENGVQTTNNPALRKLGESLTMGCAQQFRLGYYRYNDRLRDRDITLVDEERGLVLGVVMTDHTGRLRSYKLTDGSMVESHYYAPHSYYMFELFKITPQGKISQVEADFVTVPYNTPRAGRH